jgi:hypothetical protein
MAYPKRLGIRNNANKEKAIKIHEGFVNLVASRVEEIGIEKVLKQFQPALGPPTEFYWLKKAYEKVLTFAEQIQLKEIPTKLSGDEDNPIALSVYIPEVKKG